MKELLNFFFIECGEKFRFLEDKYNFREIQGLATYIKGRKIIRSFNAEKALEDDFLAVARYEGTNNVLELSFSGKFLTIEPMLFHKAIHRLNWSDVLNAFKRNGEIARSKSNLINKKDIRTTIHNYANILEENIDLFIDLKDRQFEKAMTMRSFRLEQAIKEYYQSSIDLISKQAAEAYYHKDYPTVVKLFSPHKDYLAPSDLKKYNLAKEKILKQ